MHNISCVMFATSVASSTMILKKSALQISAAILRKTCSSLTLIMAMRYHASRCNGFMDVQQTNLSGKSINSPVRNLFFGWWHTPLSSETLSNCCFFETAEVVDDDVEASGFVDVVADNVFFLLNISVTFCECLAARFKSFLAIVYSYDAHTTTLMVSAKWLI